MKKGFFIITILVSHLMFAQQVIKVEEPAKMAEGFVVDHFTTENPPISSAVSVVPFWSNDFSVAADWVLDNTGAFSNEGWNLNAIVDSWYYGSANPPLAISSTSGGSFAELTNGDPTIAGGVWPANVTYTMTTAAPIDAYAAIGSANVTLTYEEFGARFNDLQEVQISTDGVNFTTVADNLSSVVLSQTGGSSYDNPTLRSINIEPYISANPSSVWIRFSWTTNFPTQATNPMVWVTYGWMIDDVALSETPANNIELFDETFGGWFLANPSTTGDMGIPYTFNPLAQVQANPYRFEGIIINKGLNDQNNTQLNVDVTGSTGASVFSGNSTPSTLVSGDTAVVGLSSTFTPTTYGSYNCSFWASTDNILGTDTVTRSTIVTDTVYGRDYDWNYDGSAVGGQVTAGRDCGDQVVGNAFEIYATANVTSISFFVHENSIAGATVKVEMYTYDPLLAVSQSAPIWLEESDDYTLQVSDINKWVTLPLRNPLSIIPNASGDTAYIAAVYGYQGFSGDTSIIATSGSDGAVSYKYGWAYNDNCTQTKSWTGIGNTLMIRMNFGTIDPPASVFDKFGEGSSIQVYPNPNNGNFSLQFLNVEADNYTVIVKDILGKKVFEKDMFVKGIFNDNIDFSLLNKGVYLLTVSNGNHELTQKVILE